ncbi:MAG: hypothetical protein AABX51_02865, partial [Nanoarchaeota archaeon]
MDTIPIKCKNCKASEFIKWGTRKTQSRGTIQKYKCLKCNKHFTNDEGFYRMRNSEAKITVGIDLYFSNLSSRKVRNHFRRHLEANASHVSILDWCRRYTMKVTNFTDKLKPTLSGKYYMDETEIDCAGRNDFFHVAVDWETRFIPNTQYELFADVRNATEFLKKIKEKNMPK